MPVAIITCALAIPKTDFSVPITIFSPSPTPGFPPPPGCPAPFWQFAVWARQALLMVIVLMPSMWGIDETLGQMTDSLNVTDLTPEERRQVEEQRAYDRVLLYMVRTAQTITTLAVIFAFAWWTWRIKPFYRRHQNWLEMWLIVSCACVIALAFVYTILVAGLSRVQALALEATLTSVLVLTTVAAAVYLVVHYRREVTKASKMALERARRSMAQGRRSLIRRSTQLRASVWSRSSSSGVQSVSVIDDAASHRRSEKPDLDPSMISASRDESMDVFFDRAMSDLRKTADGRMICDLAEASSKRGQDEDSFQRWLRDVKPSVPSAPPPLPSDLPNDWEEFFDESSSRSYYYRHSSGETSWVRPTSKQPSRESGYSLSEEELV